MIHEFLVLMFFVIWVSKDPFHRTCICISNKSNQQQFFIVVRLSNITLDQLACEKSLSYCGVSL